MNRRIAVLVSNESVNLPSTRRTPSLRRLLATSADELKSDGFAVDVCTHRNRLFELQAETDAAVVEIPWLDLEGGLETLRIVGDRFPNWPVVLVTEDDARNLRHLARVTVDEVVFLQDLSRLPEILASIDFLKGRRFLAEQIKRRELPIRLRQALLHLVSSLQPVGTQVDVVIEPIPRTVVELASREGVSPSYLYSLASASGVRIGQFVRGVVALHAVELMARGRSLREVADGFGYRSPGAISGRVVRAFGQSARALVSRRLFPDLYVVVMGALEGRRSSEQET